MKKITLLIAGLFTIFFSAQNLKMQTLLKDKISIRALQIYDGKVWYSGTDSKFGFVSLKDSANKMQMRLSDEKLEFRTLAQDSKQFYIINILSPAYLFAIKKKSLKYKVTKVDTTKTAFFDAFIFDKFDRGIAISDPNKVGSANPLIFYSGKPGKKLGFPRAELKPEFLNFPGVILLHGKLLTRLSFRELHQQEFILSISTIKISELLLVEIIPNKQKTSTILQPQMMAEKPGKFRLPEKMAVTKPA